MPYKSDKQRRLMEGILHGMRPNMKNPPSKKIAQKFHNKARKLGDHIRAAAKGGY